MDPTETEVRYWLAGNLCRCTGYDKIVRAVMDTAKDMRKAAAKSSAKKPAAKKSSAKKTAKKGARHAA